MSYKIKLYDCWDVFDSGSSIDYPKVFNNESEAIETATQIILDECNWTFHHIDKIDNFQSEFYEKRDRPEISSKNGKTLNFDPYNIFKSFLSQAIWYDKTNPQTVFQETLRLAAERHLNQTFPGTNLPYLYHISCVANEIYAAKIYECEPNEFNLKYALSLAILHDILEDTELTEEELNEKFGLFILWGVQALTKNKKLPKAESMIDSIKRIKESPKEVAFVKIADRITNLLPPPKHWTREKIKSYYEESNYIHSELGAKSLYLGSRLAKKIGEYEKFM